MEIGTFYTFEYDVTSSTVDSGVLHIVLDSLYGDGDVILPLDTSVGTNKKISFIAQSTEFAISNAYPQDSHHVFRMDNFILKKGIPTMLLEAGELGGSQKSFVTKLNLPKSNNICYSISTRLTSSAEELSFDPQNRAPQLSTPSTFEIQDITYTYQYMGVK